MAATADDHASIYIFRKWLRMAMSGCFFANQIAAAENSTSYSVFLDDLTADDLPELNRYLDEFGDAEKYVVWLFPRVRSPRGIVRLLRALGKNERWDVCKVEWKKNSRETATLIGVGFQTKHQQRSSVMGFAPLGCMPVTRRAPFVALAMWTGKKTSRIKKTPNENAIGFIDGPPLNNEGKVMNDAEHEQAWDRTKEEVGRFLNDPKEDRSQLKQMAFCLTDAFVDEVFAA